MACGFSLVHLGLVASSLLLSACSDAGNVFDFGSPVSVLAAAGSGQSDTMGVALKLPFVARTIDANGNPAPGATVLWQVTRGGGSISPLSSVTDAAGRANAFLTLGVSADTNEAQATIAENNYPAVFVAVGMKADSGSAASATATTLASPQSRVSPR